MSVTLTDQPFEPGALLAAFSAGRTETGAIATFTGLARAALDAKLATVKRCPISGSSSDSSPPTDSMCLFGTIKICVGATGWRSRKAVTCSSR